MASGRPDFHPTMLLEGKHDTQLIPVLVDENGQMYIVMTGQQISVANLPSDYFKAGENIGNASIDNLPSDYFKTGQDVGNVAAIEANVTVDQSSADRNIKGDDTGTKRFIAVDAAGVILARLKGAYGGVLKDISVDDVGILLARMKGAYGGVLKDISVDNVGILLARMKGSYGGAMTDVAVDSGGAMISRMKGVYAGSLADVVVDSTGRIIAVMMGMEGSTPRNVAVDAGGNMIALMKGIYDSTLKTIAVDTNGIMKANLSVQDLAYLKVRPNYGQTRRVSTIGANFPAGGWTICLNTAGRGILLGGFIRLEGSTSFETSYVRVEIDGVQMASLPLSSLLNCNLDHAGRGIFFANGWNYASGIYNIGVSPGLTFEATCIVDAYNNTGAAYTLTHELFYALVP